MKKGFTLIELLAVIVILAIILLIAYPLMSNIIDNVKRGAFESSVKILVKAAENEFLKDSLDGSSIYKNFQFEDKLQVGTDTLNFKGDVPKEGYINVRPDGNTEVAITDGVYCATKLYMEQIISVRKLNEGESCTPSADFTMNTCSFETTGPLLATAPAGYIPIYTVADLININSDLHANYILMNDIDLASHGNWVPLGDIDTDLAFTGVLDGNGFSIRNMTIEPDVYSSNGLFSYAVKAKIRNLNIIDFFVPITGQYSSALIGWADDYIDIYNVKVQGNVISGDEFGGLIGYHPSSSSIIDSCVDVTIDVQSDIYSFGGFISWTFGYSYVGNSYSKINFTNPDNYRIENIGGVAGSYSDKSVVENTYVEGSYNETDNSVGGITGYTAGPLSIRNVIVDIDFENLTTVGCDIGGLIGYVSDNTPIPTNISNSYFIGSLNILDGEDIGGIVGGSENLINISNSYVEADISGSDYVGGFIGYFQTSPVFDETIMSVNNFYYQGNINGVNYVGGLFGNHNHAKTNIENSYIKGNIIGNSQVAGFVGELENSILINNSYHYGVITGTLNTNPIFGSELGDLSAVSLSNVYWNSELSGLSNSQYGSIGLNNVSFNNPSSLVGFNFDDDWKIEGNSPVFKDFNKNTPWSPSGDAPTVVLKPSEYDSKGVSINPNTCINVGTSIQPSVPNGYIGIYNPLDLYNVRDNLTGKYILMNDINLNEYISWNPIGSYLKKFTGELDGNGRTICNLNITSELAYSSSGLFSALENAIIKNMSIESFTVNSNYSGGIAGDALLSNLSNISVYGNFNFSNLSHSGVLLGKMRDSVVNDIDFNVEVTGENSYKIGGLASNIYTKNVISDINFTGNMLLGNSSEIGFIAASIGASNATNCTINDVTINGNIEGESGIGSVSAYTAGYQYNNIVFNGIVTGSIENIGGLFGRTSDTVIRNSNSVGSVTGTSAIGGLIGNSSNTTIEDSYSLSTLDGDENVGGIIGQSYGSYRSLNKLVTDNSNIYRSYYNGNITGGIKVGGLVGYGQQGIKIYDSYSKGSLNASGNFAGGVIGHHDNIGVLSYTARIDNSFSSMSVSGTGFVGGLAGGMYGKSAGSSYLDRSYANGPLTGGTIGGLIANSSFVNVSSVYWDTGTTGAATSTVGVGKTSLEMQTQATFVGWDFTNKWLMTGYPKLRWE